MLGMARASVQKVVLLHNLAVGLSRSNGLPGNVTLTESAKIAEELQADQRAAQVLEGSNASAASLATVQGLYAALALEVHNSAGSTDKTLPAKFSEDLASADKQWRTLLIVIGRSAGVDLLKNVPPLLMPQHPTTTIPPPPK